MRAAPYPSIRGADRPLLGTAASDLALYLHRNEVIEGIYDSDIQKNLEMYYFRSGRSDSDRRTAAGGRPTDRAAGVQRAFRLDGADLP